MNMQVSLSIVSLYVLDLLFRRYVKLTCAPFKLRHSIYSKSIMIFFHFDTAKII